MRDRDTATRRRFLCAAAATAASCPTTDLLAVPEDPLLIIDCHAHIYGEDEQRYPTVEDPYRPPAGTGTVDHLRREMQVAGVSHVTAIQTSSYYRWDNRFTADTARASRPWMVGVVTLNPDDATSPSQLERFVNDFNVRGMRSICGSLRTNWDWIAKPRQRSWEEPPNACGSSMHVVDVC